MITATTPSTTPTGPGATTPSSTGPGGALGKNEFLKLLVAQLQNQDPMNPMQGDQMAAQLAQFSSLEQLQQINETLTNQQSASGSLLGAIQSTAAINTIGHTVIAIGDEVQIGGTNGATTVAANVSSNGATATLRILDENGKEVGSRALGAVGAGRQTFDIGTAADKLPPGVYHYAIDVKDAAGKPVTVQTYTTGKVDGMSTGQNGLVLTAGGLTIPYANIVQIIK